MKNVKRIIMMGVIFLVFTSEAEAQSYDQIRRAQSQVDSALSVRYYRNKGDIDTAYISRPQTKWTLVARMNVSGAKIKSEGMENGRHFLSEMEADRKGTICLGVSFLGFSVSAALNPAKMLGKYRDYELNFNSYGKRFGFDFVYQDAHNFTGWYEKDGKERVELPADLLTLKTLNLNAYYAFNGSRFSYPAAFTQSYIQRRSAGSWMLAVSGQGQHGIVKGVNEDGQKTGGEQEMQFKMTNIGIGGGYGYNYVPSQGWLLHISALPTFIVYSRASIKFDDTKVPLHYHFPEAIITGRGAVVRQVGNKFFGLNMVFNFTGIGNKDNLSIHNIKWRLRAFFGLRL